MASGSLFAVLTAVLVLALVYAEYRHSRMAIWLIKPLASTGFIATAIVGNTISDSYQRAMIAALVLSWWGDLLLIPKSKKAFLGGLLSFLLGHVAFCVAFVALGISITWFALALLVMVVIGAGIARWLLPQVERAMRPPVAAYMLVITTMVALAAAAVGDGATPLLLAAAVIFYASDLSVARDKFVAPGFDNRAWGLPAYYGAQVLFALLVHR